MSAMGFRRMMGGLARPPRCHSACIRTCSSVPVDFKLANDGQFQVALKKKNRPGLRKIASILGVGVGTVQRISRELM